MQEGKIYQNTWSKNVQSSIDKRYLRLNHKKEKDFLLLDMSSGKIFKCWEEGQEKLYTIELAERKLPVHNAIFCLKITLQNPLIIQRTFQILRNEEQKKAFKKYVEAYFRYAIDVVYQIVAPDNSGGKGNNEIVIFWLTFMNEGTRVLKKSLPVQGYNKNIREEIITEYLKEWLFKKTTCTILK